MSALGARPRLLFVDVKWPAPTRDAASQRTVQLAESLTALGFAVDFAAMFPTESPDEVRFDMTTTGARELECADEDAIARHVAVSALEYAGAVFCWTRVAQRMISRMRAVNPGAFVVFDTVDVNHVREYRHARLTGNANLVRRALVMKQQELAAVRAADCTLAITPADAAKLRAECPEARIEVVTLLSPFAPAPGAPRGARDGLVFLGNFQAAPNVDAALQLAGPVLDAFPADSRPRLTLVGSDPPAEVAALASPAVEVLGHRPDLRSVFDAHLVFVCPIRFGSGIKGKLLAALASGIPVVASTIAVEGTAMRDGVEFLLADEPGAVVDAVTRVQDDDALWNRLVHNGLEYVRVHHGRPVLERQVTAVFRSLAADGRARVPG